MSTKEKGLFTVSEHEQYPEEEVFEVEEEELELPVYPGTKPEEMPSYSEMYPEEMKSDDEKDWRKSGKAEQFLDYLKEEFKRIPKPSELGGKGITEMEGALGKWRKLDSMISREVRRDFDDKIDLKEVDAMRQKIDAYIDALDDMLDGFYSLKKKRRLQRKKRFGEEEFELTKEATTPSFKGIQMHISAFERAIVGAIINGKVAGGRNIEDLYATAKSKYDINPREELAIMQILADFGYPVFKDRLRLGDDEDPSRDEGFGEWASQYQA